MLLHEIHDQIRQIPQYEKGKFFYDQFEQNKHHYDPEIIESLERLFHDLLTSVKSRDQSGSRRILDMIDHLMHDSHPKEDKLNNFSNLVDHPLYAYGKGDEFHEALNLYNLHSKPESLDKHDQAKQLMQKPSNYVYVYREHNFGRNISRNLLSQIGTLPLDQLVGEFRLGSHVHGYPNCKIIPFSSVEFKNAIFGLGKETENFGKIQKEVLSITPRSLVSGIELYNPQSFGILLTNIDPKELTAIQQMHLEDEGEGEG